MKKERRFLERMSEIDDELITRADELVVVNSKKNFHKKLIIIAAAILAVCTVSATVTALYVRNKNSHVDCDCIDDVIEVPISDVFWIDKREKNANKLMMESSALVFPWNEREAYEKYTELVINGEKYSARSSYYGEEIFANQIGKKLADAECSGYDNYDEKKYTESCEVFEIIGVDSERFVAIKYNNYDGYYPFIKEKHVAPSTLGALIDTLNLTKNIRLNDFFYEGNNAHYALSNENSDALWNIIKEYSSAPIVSEKVYHNSSNELSFAIYSNALGAYNLSFSFSKDGYLKTNIENYGYAYDIGTEGVAKIIDFARKNRLAILVPQTQYLVGIITEIGEDYIKVDDSVMMKNSDEGIEFTVYSNRRNKLSTYIKFNIFKVGDAVSIEHSYLAKEGYTQVNNAVKISKCTITVDGDVLIPE